MSPGLEWPPAVQLKEGGSASRRAKSGEGLSAGCFSLGDLSATFGRAIPVRFCSLRQAKGSSRWKHAFHLRGFH